MIRDIVFDIGRVIVGIHPEPMLEFLVSRGAPRLDLNATLERVGLCDHETGRMDGAGLIERFGELAPWATATELRQHWLDIFRPHEDMIRLAHQVRCAPRRISAVQHR